MIRIRFKTLVQFVYFFGFLVLWILPYNPKIYYLLQVCLIPSILYYARQKPSLITSSIVVLGILPDLMMGSTSINYIQHYSLHGISIIVLCATEMLYLLLCRKIRFNFVFITSFLLGCYLLISKVFARNDIYYNLNFYVAVSLYICLPYFILDKEDVLITWEAFITAGTLFTLKLFPRVFLGNTIYESQVLNDRNFMSLKITIFLVVTVVYMMKYVNVISKKMISLLCILTAAMLFVILSFASRTAFVVIVVFAGSIIIYYFKHNKKLVFVTASLVVILCLIINSTGVMKMLGVRFQEETLTTGAGRTIVFAGFIQMFLDEGWPLKLFGQGHLVSMARYNFASTYAHNTYLQILLDFGLIGFSLFLTHLSVVYHGLNKGQFKMFRCSMFAIMVYIFALHAETDWLTVAFFMSCTAVVNCKNLHD